LCRYRANDIIEGTREIKMGKVHEHYQNAREEFETRTGLCANDFDKRLRELVEKIPFGAVDQLIEEVESGQAEVES